MADDTSQEKTEEPTSKRLEESREKGQVANTKELSTFLVTITGAVVMLLFGGGVYQSLKGFMESAFMFSRVTLESKATSITFLGESVRDVGAALMAPFILLVISSVLAPLLMKSITWSAKPLIPDLKKLDPIKGIARIFSVRGLMELVKGLGKFMVIGTTGLLLVYFNSDRFLALSQVPLAEGIKEGVLLMAWCFIFIALSLAVIVAIDVPFQLWDHQRKLKMSKQEVKDEHKDTEGKPEVKGRIRQLQIEFARARMMSDIPQADVVITNPTHFAVALKYDAEKGGAPRVVAKGQDLLAQTIRNIATEHEVPIISAPPLARALYHSTEINDFIPMGLYKAVAQVLALVFSLKRKKSKSAFSGLKPMDDLPIPEEYRR